MLNDYASVFPFGTNLVNLALSYGARLLRSVDLFDYKYENVFFNE